MSFLKKYLKNFGHVLYILSLLILALAVGVAVLGGAAWLFVKLIGPTAGAVVFVFLLFVGIIALGVTLGD